MKNNPMLENYYMQILALTNGPSGIWASGRTRRV